MGRFFYAFTAGSIFHGASVAGLGVMGCSPFPCAHPSSLLVAELGAARVSYELGFDSRILSNSAAYLDSWIAALKQEPSFILTVMNDVEKASKLILDKVAV